MHAPTNCNTAIIVVKTTINANDDTPVAVTTGGTTSNILANDT
jgi:hypothetical protein